MQNVDARPCSASKGVVRFLPRLLRCVQGDMGPCRQSTVVKPTSSRDGSLGAHQRIRSCSHLARAAGTAITASRSLPPGLEYDVK